MLNFKFQKIAMTDNVDWQTFLCFHLHLKSPGQEFVLHLQEIALVGLGLERLIDDGELGVILNVLPSSIAMTVMDQRSRI